jgi:sugar-specific transcriptional regulator TrmB
MTRDREPAALLAELDLKEYEATALEQLLSLGRTTAPNLAEATDIPKARIYDVLENLGERGFVKIIPGRPKEYQPKPPAEILQRAEENSKQAFEDRQRELEELREPFLETFEPRFEQADQDVTPTEELFWVVDVGEASERETRTLYHEADQQVHVITKSFEYFDSVRPAFEDALDRGLSVQALLLHPRHLEPDNREIQSSMVARLQAEYPALDIRFSEEKLPWRGTLVDPSMDYETGQAIFLVEEKDVPLHMRQAAVTDNGSLVAGLQRYFELIWAHESVGEYPELDE